MKVLRYNAAVFMRRPERLQLAFKMMAIPRYVRQREREREREKERERERRGGWVAKRSLVCFATAYHYARDYSDKASSWLNACNLV